MFKYSQIFSLLIESERNKMNTYSYSKLGTFEQCPLKFKFAYIDELETEIEESVEAFLGSRVHEALEKLYTDLRFQKLLTLEELLNFFNDSWKKNWNDAIVIVRDEYDEENYRKMGEKFLTDYYNTYKPFNQSRTVALETKKTVELDNDNKYFIHIRIDRLALADDNIYEIHDYKTSNTLPTQEELDKNEQLAIYAYGVKKMYRDAKRIILVWHYLAFDKEMRSERTDEELENLRKEIIRSIKEIEECTKFPPRVSALCEWCEFRPVCPNFKHLYEIEEKPPEEYLANDGVKLANSFAEVSEKLEEYQKEFESIRDALVIFAKKSNINTVYGSDIKVSVRSYPKLSFPKKEDKDRDEFIKALRDIGLWERISSPDVYELAKIINNNELHPDLMKLIDKFIKKGENITVRLLKK